MNRLGLLTNFLNTRYKQHAEMRENVLQMESQCGHLSAIGSEIDESMKVGLLISSFREYKACNPTNLSIHTLQNYRPPGIT